MIKNRLRFSPSSFCSGANFLKEFYLQYNIYRNSCSAQMFNSYLLENVWILIQLVKLLGISYSLHKTEDYKLVPRFFFRRHPKHILINRCLWINSANPHWPIFPNPCKRSFHIFECGLRQHQLKF